VRQHRIELLHHKVGCWFVELGTSVLQAQWAKKIPISPQDAEIAAISITRTQQFPRRDDISAICRHVTRYSCF
jgi:hypothetical protein